MSATARKPKSQTVEAPTDIDLPEGWATARLEEICEPPQYGWTTSADHDKPGLKLLRTTDISAGKVDWSTVPSCEESPDDVGKYLLKPGDLVVSRAGSVGISYLLKNPPRAIFASYLIRFRPVPPVESDFISIFFKSPKYWSAIAEESSGIAVPNVNASKLKQIELPLPPITEQKRIVTKVEELLARLKASREHLAKAPLLLKRFRQAVLTAACSGRLTEDWRMMHPHGETASVLLDRIRRSHEVSGFTHGGKAALPTEDVHTLTEDEFPESWALAELQLLCVPGRSITYGILKPGTDQPRGIPYIRVADFPNDRLNLEGIRRTSREIAHEYRRSTLRFGDVLLSIRGTVGRVCRVPDALDGANITQDTARLSVHAELSADYVEMHLRCPSIQKRLEAAMKGVAVRGVNIGDVRALQVAVPPVPEQHEIVRRVEDLFKHADAIESQVKAATMRAEKLTQAILAKAFRGELVPTEAELARREGRDYEPAAALLARIRTEKQAATAASLAKKASRVADTAPPQIRRPRQRGLKP